MNKIIKNLSVKIDRLELGNKNQNKPIPEGERNQNQFRRPFVPRFLPRERRNNDIQRERRENEEQRIQPPFQNNHVRDDESYEIDEGDLDDLEEQEHSISQFDDDSSSHFLTKVWIIVKKMIIKCICLKFVRRFHRNHMVLNQE